MFVRWKAKTETVSDTQLQASQCEVSVPSTEALRNFAHTQWSQIEIYWCTQPHRQWPRVSMAGTGRAAMLPAQGVQYTLRFMVFLPRFPFLIPRRWNIEMLSERRNCGCPFQEGMKNFRHTFLPRWCSSVFSGPPFAQQYRLPRKRWGADWLSI